MIGQVPTALGALVLCAIAHALRRVPRDSRHRWLLPAWALVVCVATLLWLFDIYAVELYSVFELFRDPAFATSPYLETSPRARYALTGALALATLCAAIALDLSRSRFGSKCHCCLHELLDAQQDCPECGAPRETGPMRGATRLDALAVRKPQLAWFLELASLAIVASSFMAIAIAFVPTLRAQSSRHLRQLHALDGTPVLTEATVTTEANHVLAPLLPWLDWRLDKLVRVRVTAERSQADAMGPRTDVTTPRTILTRHFIDIDINEEIRTIDDYARLRDRMDADLPPNIDRSRLQARIELLMVDFLGLPESDVPKTALATGPLKPRMRNGPTQFGFQSWIQVDEWPRRYSSDWNLDRRDSYVAALVIPCAVGLLATAVFLWPPPTPHARRARTRSHS